MVAAMSKPGSKIGSQEKQHRGRNAAGGNGGDVDPAHADTNERYARHQQVVDPLAFIKTCRVCITRPIEYFKKCIRKQHGKKRQRKCPLLVTDHRAPKYGHSKLWRKTVQPERG